MAQKQLLRITFTMLAVSIAALAIGAPNKDAYTLKKIDEAVNVHYIAAQFDKAESVLLAAIKGCGAKACSGNVIAKAYIYVGIVRGNGKQDLAGAHQAFENAQAADPNVTIDAALVTPTVLAEFNKVMGRENAVEGAPVAEAEDETGKPAEKKPGLPRVAPVGELRCSPASGYEIQTAQPISINCERMSNVVRGELYYEPMGAEDYTAVLMRFDPASGTLRAQIPCDALTIKGSLKVYVIAQDANKDMVDTFGNALQPVQYSIVDKTTQAVPTFPGEAAPKRCTDLLVTEGVASGKECTPDARCRKGLYCNSGVCRKIPACETDTDCESDHCVSSLCEMRENFGSKAVLGRWLVGIHVALDTWLSPAAKNVCGGSNAASGDYNCYNAGSTKINEDPNDPQHWNFIPMADANFGGNIKTTLVPATVRVLASVDYAITPKITAGGRLGMAFRGGPASIHYDQGVPSQNKSFLPVHVELRGAYWFKPLDVPGLHPYVALGFGVAQVDAKVPLTVWADNSANQPKLERSLDAWRKMGTTFAAIGFGGLVNVGKRNALQLNVNAMYMLPSTGIVLEPSFGYVRGF